ncbi:hypothetical protein HAP94_06305 [Acidithiobacillus ferrivorans]|nr:hypothetical protein [Acidithiobacillus ferrivorans]
MENVIEKQAVDFVNIVENRLDLAAINPRNGPQFSPNLHRFLRNRGKAWANTCRVFRDADNVLWIGSLDYGWLHGARLMGVLCHGTLERVMAHVPSIGFRGDLQEITSFWADYMRIGRCALDPEHQKSFVGDETRWAVSDDGHHRSCLWCGNAHQKLETWVEQVQHERWAAL